MTTWDLFQHISFNVIGGLGIFLLGMKYLSDGLQTIAGDRLRGLIKLVTDNRLMATGVGVLVTAVIQSSSITTVMVVGFVNSGFMTLTQAIGVILGANIGTTITAWIIVLPIAKFGLPLFGVAALAYAFGKRESFRYIALAAMGLGMIFFGLELMKAGFKPLRSSSDFQEWFAYFNADSVDGFFNTGVLKCALVGCVLTMILQSSSAATVITISLATLGIISFRSSAALVLGQNIGTTITAYLASLGATTNAKRAAYAHTIFNVAGVFIIILLFEPYMKVMDVVIKFFFHHSPVEVAMENGKEIYPYVDKGIATVHTCFNLCNTLLFIPFVSQLARLLEKIVPEKPFKEAPHLTRLDVRLLETPFVGIEQAHVEIGRMGSTCRKMLRRLDDIVKNDDFSNRKSINKLFHKEEVLDTVQKEIVFFLTELLTDNVSHDVADNGRRHLRMADELESIGDYGANIMKLHLRLRNAGLEMPEKEKNGLIELHKMVEDYMDLILKACETRNVDVITKAHARGDAITHKVRELRNMVMDDVSAQKMDPLIPVIFSDIMNAYRRIKDHSLNLAEALGGDK